MTSSRLRVGDALLNAESALLCLNDAAFELCLACGFTGLLDTGYVDGVGRRILEIAAPHVLVEERRLRRKYFEHPLVDAVLGE